MKVGNKNGTSLIWFLRNRHAIEYMCRTYISFLQTGFSLRDKRATDIYLFYSGRKEKERKRLCCQCEVSNSNVDLASFPFSVFLSLHLSLYLTTISFFFSRSWSSWILQSVKHQNTLNINRNVFNQATRQAHKSTLRYMQIRPVFLTVVNSVAWALSHCIAAARKMEIC